MHYKEWEPIYKRILHDFGFSMEKDEFAARLLDSIIEDSDEESAYSNLHLLLHREEVFVCGNGPSLRDKIDVYAEDLKKCILVAADGATTTLMRAGLIPDVIVSDLDGFVPHQLDANRKGSVMVIHAHGDNIGAINKWCRKFKKVLGTTQADPKRFKNLFNFGGFTDGDRAAFLAEHFGASRLYLLAFDLDKVP